VKANHAFPAVIDREEKIEGSSLKEESNHRIDCRAWREKQEECGKISDDLIDVLDEAKGQ
jgi:hypothetical protein